MEHFEIQLYNKAHIQTCILKVKPFFLFQAEARLAARRQARAEAREIRMKELERQQKEQEQNADRVFDMQTAAGIDPLSRTRLTVGLNSSLNSVRGNSISSRRSSEDSLEDEGRTLRDFRHEVKVGLHSSNMKS